ncbi:MAG: 2-keto-4-pentenoate hydratase [Rhodospirillales bacterium]|jgi:2-keto-4-pentenoate hydratase
MDDLAAAIAAARLARTPLVLPPMAHPADAAAGYAVQAAVHARLAGPLGGRVGWKIGCTTAVMQAYLAIPSPCAGGIFAADLRADGAVIAPAERLRPGVECEIAVRLARDLDARSGPVGAAAVAAALDCAMVAIEIVDDRSVDWTAMGAPTLIADDFFAAGCVLGPPVPASRLPDLAAVAGTTVVDGAVAGHGTGADVLGHPLAAVAWLAGHLAARGGRVLAGEIVLCGSLVRTVWLAPGQRATIAVEGLGRVSVVLAA